MADRKHFIVLGLGTFGAALSKQLSKNGCHVTGIDETREQVEELRRQDRPLAAGQWRKAL